jgi:membrane protease YdiL (CAAX protease family)
VIVAIMVVGAVAVASAWRLVAARRASIWVTMAIVNVAAGGAALATRRVHLAGSIGGGKAAAVGTLLGFALYFATVVFVLFIRRAPRFSRHVSALYGERGDLPLPGALALAAGITAPGEELFWRGLFQTGLSQPGARSAVITWLAYVTANALSASLPITAAAIVAGGVWGGLALGTGGVLASMLCHAVWTGLMVALPPPGFGPDEPTPAEAGP